MSTAGIPPTLRLFDGYPHTTPHLQGEVRKLQTLLQNVGYNLAVDGYYSPHTEFLVKSFQKSRGLPETGIAEQRTWATLQSPRPVVPTPAPATASRYRPDDPHLLRQLEAFRLYENVVREAARKDGVPVHVIAGIGSRESHWGLALVPPGPAGTGDHGRGRGLMQVDDRWHAQHTAGDDWTKPEIHIPYALGVLKWSTDTVARHANITDPALRLKAGIAAYNAGWRAVVQAVQEGRDVDTATTGRNYASDVLDRGEWFKARGVV